MPVMDGFQATAAIRSLKEGDKARLPIIAMTAHAMLADRDRCLKSGMNAFLSKPVQGKDLVDAVERLGGHAL